MESRWNDSEANACRSELDLRVYTSRLLGADPALILYGGGNTSVKVKQLDLFGNQQDILYVKGSGWDLKTIEADGFAPLRLEPVKAMVTLESLSDPDMMRELKALSINPSAPAPSVETILHAILPYAYVDHTHANSVLAITNSSKGDELVNEIYADQVVIVPYVMPGFDLAKLCSVEYKRQAGVNTIGMVLMNHGIFSFASSARESYERMITLVDKAEQYLRAKNAYIFSSVDRPLSSSADPLTLARLRADVCSITTTSMLMLNNKTSMVSDYIARKDLNQISQQGPITPDHVIRTKRLPLIGRDLAKYSQEYQQYFNRNNARSGDNKTMLDTAPRVILDDELGMCTFGKSAQASVTVSTIYQHTINVICSSAKLSEYVALADTDIFDVEYWDLEQAKLNKAGKPLMFSGESVLITGAASGIGLACVKAFLNLGAAVIGLDKNPAITALSDNAAYLGLVCNLSDENQIKHSIAEAVRRFGGIDMLVLNAGIFPQSCKIESMSSNLWRDVMSVNLDATMVVLRECLPYLKLAYHSGRIVLIGSKNVTAPGPGAAAYSCAKAAVNQLARVAALELADNHIRINTLHPDAIFDTGIWNDQILAERAAHYGLDVEQYKTKNLLGVELQSQDVAGLAAALCGPLFSKSTGIQIAIDGGNERVI